MKENLPFLSVTLDDCNSLMTFLAPRITINFRTKLKEFHDIYLPETIATSTFNLCLSSSIRNSKGEIISGNFVKFFLRFC